MPHSEREIYLVGLNHRTAGVQVREAFALADVPMLEDGLLPVSRHLDCCASEHDEPPAQTVSAAGVACLAGQYAVSPDVFLAAGSPAELSYGMSDGQADGLPGGLSDGLPGGLPSSLSDEYLGGQSDALPGGRIGETADGITAAAGSAVKQPAKLFAGPRSSQTAVTEGVAPANPGKADHPRRSFVKPAGNWPEIREAMVLSTCNRVEILAVGAPGADETIISHWAAACGKKPEDLEPYVYRHSGADAVKHLFTVAASLDSMVLGEPQILGQLKGAYKKALGLGATKVILNRLLHRAFSVAKRVRSETGVASSAVSISYAAVELAKRIFGDMSAYRAMLIGAGEMAELAAAHLINAGIKSVWVSNRTHSRAVELAAQWTEAGNGRCDGRAVPFEQLFEQLHEVDIVISSTGAQEAIISARDMGGVMRRRKNRPMFFIDIAVPRDIDPDVNGLDNIYLYDIDDLKEVVEENLAQRQEEAVKARAIVDEESEGFLRWQSSLSLQPTIIQMIRRTEQIAEEELNRTLRKLDVDEETEQALRAMMRSMAKKLNHKPITFLKRRHDEEEAGMEYLGIVRRIFDLDDDRIPEDAHADRKRHR